MISSVLLTMSLVATGAGDAAPRFITAAERAEISALMCEPPPCEDRAYGACGDNTCSRLDVASVLGPDAEQAKLEYAKKCVLPGCMIAEELTTPIDASGRTLNAALDAWDAKANEVQGCRNPPLTIEEFFLPSEIDPEFGKTLRNASCGMAHADQGMRSRVLERNRRRCRVLQRPSSDGCWGLPCGAWPTDVAHWMQAQRRVCPSAEPGVQAVCRSVPSNVASFAKTLGATCPPASLVTRGNPECDFTVLPTQDMLTFRTRLGERSDVIAESPMPSPDASSDLWLPGAHAMSNDGLPIATRSELEWQSADEAQLTAGQRYVVLSAASTGPVLWEAFSIANPPVPEVPILMPQWTLADLTPLSCSDEASDQCASEFAWFQRELAMADPHAKPMGGRPAVEVLIPGDIAVTRRRCYETSHGALCVEVQGTSTMPPARSPRLVAWRAFESPLLASARVDESLEAIYAYFQTRLTPTPHGARLGVVDLLGTNGKVSAALIGVTGEPHQVVHVNTAGASSISPAGHLVERYLAPLADTQTFDPAKSVDHAKAVTAAALALAPGILVTDPIVGRGRAQGACALTSRGPMCGKPGQPAVPVLREAGNSTNGLDLFSDAYQAIRGGSPTNEWQPAQAVLESILGEGSPANSLIRVVSRPPPQGPLAILASDVSSQAACSGTFALLDIPSDPTHPGQPATRFRLIARPSANQVCQSELLATLTEVQAKGQLNHLMVAVRAMFRIPAISEVEVVAGPAVEARRAGLLELVVIGLSVPAGGQGAMINLTRPELTSASARPLSAVATDVGYTRGLSTIAERSAFATCFLARTCIGPRPNGRYPSAYFSTP